MHPTAGTGASTSSQQYYFGSSAAATHLLNARGIGAVETPYRTCFHAGGHASNHDEEEEEAPKAAVRDLARELVLLTNDKNAAPPTMNEKDASACFTELLLRVLSGLYETETQFSTALFDAMAYCLRQWTPSGGVLKVDDARILLTQRSGNSAAVDDDDGVEYEYATGLARGALASLPDDHDLVLDIDDDEAARTTEHAWVVYRRPTANNESSEWKVWRALAVVDVSRGHTKWNLRRSDHGRGNVHTRSLASLSRGTHNGPLAQVVMKTFAYAAPGIASLGELPRLIPFAVVHCRTVTNEGNTTSEESVVDDDDHVGWWVHGNLVTPNSCGEFYSFNVDAYGTMHPREEEFNGLSLAAYVGVMTHGLQVARRWLQRLQGEARGVLPAPHPLTGRNLRFGSRTGVDPDTVDDLTLVIANPTLTLLATPIRNYCADGDRRFYRVHQGELFRASVDVNRLRLQLSHRNRVKWCPDAYDPVDAAIPQHDVLIKVTSHACFDLLIPSLVAYLYRVTDDAWEREPEVRTALAGSLHGFYVTPDGGGLVQLLPDLPRLGYKSLPHGNDLRRRVGGWGAVWKAFANLVRTVLLPLARAGIVHADLRPGYDETANLLYHQKSESMRMIDLDSLCAFELFCRVPSADDPRHLSARDLPAPLLNAGATGYVLGQVLCAGEVWHGAIPQRDVDASEAVHMALPRRRPAREEASGAAKGGSRGRLDREDAVGGGGSGGGSGGSSNAFDGRTYYDAEDKFVAVVNEDLIHAALESYQAKFDRLPWLSPGSGGA